MMLAVDLEIMVKKMLSTQIKRACLSIPIYCRKKETVRVGE